MDFGSAFGELGITLTGILCLPPLIFIVIMILNGKKFFLKGFKYLLFASIPLIAVLLFNYANQRGKELRYVGTYYLNKYPNCNSCVLNLKENNKYIISKNNYPIEKGTWNYIKNEYWTVQIGKNGTLGRGVYSYRKKKLDRNKFKKRN